MANPYYNNIRTNLPLTIADGNSIDDDFDAITSGLNAVASDVMRSIKLPVGTLNDQVILGSVAARANKVLSFDASGALFLSSNAFVVADIATTQAGIATTQAGIATTQAGIATAQATAALATNPQVRMNPSVVTADLSIPDYYNAYASGPLEVATGVTITVGANANLNII